LLELLPPATYRVDSHALSTRRSGERLGLNHGDQRREIRQGFDGHRRIVT